MGVLQGYIVERGGEEAHDEALAGSAEHAARPFLGAYEGLDLRGRAPLLAERLRASGSTFSVEQDARAHPLRCDPWGPAALVARAGRAGRTREPRRYEGDRIVYPAYGGGEDLGGRLPDPARRPGR